MRREAVAKLLNMQRHRRQESRRHPSGLGTVSVHDRPAAFHQADDSAGGGSRLGKERWEVNDRIPSFISTATAEKIAAMVDRRCVELLEALRHELGRVQVDAMGTKNISAVLYDVAFAAAEEAAGVVAVERACDADRASFNMLHATLAGIELASRKGGTT